MLLFVLQGIFGINPPDFVAATVALAFGGRLPGNSPTGVTEEYNGSSWSPSNSLNTARFQIAGAGTQTAALAFGSRTPGASEEYDGTSWAEGNNLNTARFQDTGAGTATADGGASNNASHLTMVLLGHLTIL